MAPTDRSQPGDERAGASEAGQSEPDYALRLADDSYAWYQRAAIRARRAYKVAETVFLVVTACIPLSAVVWPDSGVIPAILGSISVVIAGGRAIFHWQDNYLRFSEAREAVEAERRLYRTRSAPYDADPTRDALLVKAVTRIEQAEMRGWVKISVGKPNESDTGDAAT